MVNEEQQLLSIIHRMISAIDRGISIGLKFSFPILFLMVWFKCNKIQVDTDISVSTCIYPMFYNFLFVSQLCFYRIDIIGCVLYICVLK